VPNDPLNPWSHNKAVVPDASMFFHHLLQVQYRIDNATAATAIATEKFTTRSLSLYKVVLSLGFTTWLGEVRIMNKMFKKKNYEETVTQD
jgi:hypothetical protein